MSSDQTPDLPEINPAAVKHLLDYIECAHGSAILMLHDSGIASHDACDKAAEIIAMRNHRKQVVRDLYKRSEAWEASNLLLDDAERKIESLGVRLSRATFELALHRGAHLVWSFDGSGVYEATFHGEVVATLSTVRTKIRHRPGGDGVACFLTVPSMAEALAQWPFAWGKVFPGCPVPPAPGLPTYSKTECSIGDEPVTTTVADVAKALGVDTESETPAAYLNRVGVGPWQASPIGKTMFRRWAGGTMAISPAGKILSRAGETISDAERSTSTEEGRRVCDTALAMWLRAGEASRG